MVPWLRQTRHVPEAAWDMVALAARQAVLARAVGGGLGTGRTLSPRTLLAGPPAGQPRTWAAAWSHFVFLLIVISDHGDVQGEGICTVMLD